MNNFYIISNKGLPFQLERGAAAGVLARQAAAAGGAAIDEAALQHIALGAAFTAAEPLALAARGELIIVQNGPATVDVSGSCFGFHGMAPSVFCHQGVSLPMAI